MEHRFLYKTNNFNVCSDWDGLDQPPINKRYGGGGNFVFKDCFTAIKTKQEKMEIISVAVG